MPAAAPQKLKTWEVDSNALNVIIETPKGSRNKFAFNPDEGVFELSKVLPYGLVFPFHFGFVPSTLAADGDPMDAILLMDAPVFPGCKIPSRLIGVIKAKQTDKKGKTVRNDRLLVVAKDDPDYQEFHSPKKLPAALVQEIEIFFTTYHKLDGERFRSMSCKGPTGAAKLLKEAQKRFRGKGRK
jgi:inorganic pyrophosphatase